MNTSDIRINEVFEDLLEHVLADDNEAKALCERTGSATVNEAREKLRAQADAMHDALRLQRARTQAIVGEIASFTHAQASALLAAVEKRQRAMVDASWDGDHAEQLVAELALANDLDPKLDALKARLRELEQDATAVRH